MGKWLKCQPFGICRSRDWVELLQELRFHHVPVRKLCVIREDSWARPDETRVNDTITTSSKSCPSDRQQGTSRSNQNAFINFFPSLRAVRVKIEMVNRFEICWYFNLQWWKWITWVSYSICSYKTCKNKNVLFQGTWPFCRLTIAI